MSYLPECAYAVNHKVAMTYCTTAHLCCVRSIPGRVLVARRLGGGAEVDMRDVQIEEQQGAASLVLGRGGDLLADSQVGQKRRDLGRAHLAQVAQLVKAEVARGPTHIRLFDADRVVFAAELIEQFGRVSHPNLGAVYPLTCHGVGLEDTSW
jgi:hypothetical protein